MKSDYDVALEFFHLTRHSSIEEIKTEYRKAAKKYHPDLNKGIDPKMFTTSTKFYNYLLDNHKPVAAPKPKADISKRIKYFRLLTKMYNEIISIPYNDSELPEDIVIICMRNSIEFRINLNKGQKIPVTLEITNVGAPFLVTIKSDDLYAKYKSS